MERKRLPIQPPSTLGNDRDSQGRFAHGNHLGVGNPLAAAAAKLRAAMFRAVKVGDLEGIVKSMIRPAKAGDVAAGKLGFAIYNRGPSALRHFTKVGNLGGETWALLATDSASWKRASPAMMTLR